MRLNKHGFVLQELIVTMVITSIMMLALVSFTATIGRVYVESRTQNEQRLIMSIIKEYLKSQLTLAKDIQSTSASTFNKLEFKDNRVYLNNADAFDADFYGNNAITIAVSGFGSLLTFDITIETSGGEILTEKVVLKTLNKANNNIASPITVIYYK